MILNRTDNPLSRIERNKLNNNWDLIERGVSDVDWKANNALDVANALINNAFDDAALQANIEEKLNDLEVQYAPQLTEVESKTESNTLQITDTLTDIAGVSFDTITERMESDISYSFSAMSKNKTISYDNVSYPLMMAHRGFSVARAEHTIISYDLALSYCNCLELDVQKTLDGKYICIHDQTLNNTTNMIGDVSTMDYSEIKKANASAKFNNGVTSKSYVPLLEEVLDRYGDKVLYCIEFKDTTSNVESATEILDMVIRKGLLNNVTFESFNQIGLTTVKNLNDNAKTILLASDELPTIETLQTLGCWGVGISYQVLNASNIVQYKNAGFKVVTYTVNDVTSYEKMVSLGADCIMSDDIKYISDMFGEITILPKKVVVPKKYISSGFTFGGTVKMKVVNDGIGFPSKNLGSGSLGIGVRINNTRYQIKTIVKALDVVQNTTDRFGFFIASDTDYIRPNWGNPSGQNAISVEYRNNGTVVFYKMHTDANVEAQVFSEFPQYNNGESIPIKIDVYTDRIIFTREDTGNSCEFYESTFSRDGWLGVFSWNQGVSFGDFIINEL